MTSLDDAFAEGGIVSLRGGPTLDEGEGEVVVPVAIELKGLATVGLPHAVPALDQQQFERILLTRCGVKLGHVGDAHQNGTSVLSNPVPGWRPPTAKQKSTASSPSCSSPSPTCQRPPAGPVRVSEKAWPWRLPHSVTTSATRRPSCDGVRAMGAPVARLMSRRCIQVSRVKIVSTK